MGELPGRTVAPRGALFDFSGSVPVHGQIMSAVPTFVGIRQALERHPAPTLKASAVIPPKSPSHRYLSIFGATGF